MAATMNHCPIRISNIRQAIHKVIAEEESYAHNIPLDSHKVTADTFCQTPITPNTQGENKNTILTREKRSNSDAPAETLKGLKISDAGYNESESDNTKHAKGDPASDSKIAIHTSDGKKRKVTDTSNGYFQQELLSNRTPLIITTVVEPRIEDMAVTCSYQATED